MKLHLTVTFSGGIDVDGKRWEIFDECLFACLVGCFDHLSVESE